MKYGCQSMYKKIDTILIKTPEHAFLSQENLNQNWEKYQFFGCPDYEACLKEYRVFESVIRENVENVLVLPADERVGLDSIYAHDPLKVTQKGAIYFPMGKAERRNESYATQEFMESKGIPTLGRITSPGKMEGGDVVWIDERTVAIGRGYRTNDEGIRQFKELTKGMIDTYFIVPMPHGGGEVECLHLMSIISIVDEKKAVVYSKFMPVIFREFLLKRGFELIEVNDEEYDQLGCNVLALAPGKVVVIDSCKDIKTKMEAAGITVYTYPGKNISYYGTGGPTCFTCPVYRI